MPRTGRPKGIPSHLKGVPWSPEQREKLRLRLSTPEARESRRQASTLRQQRLRERMGEEAYKARLAEIGKKAALVRTRAPRAKRIFDQREESEQTFDFKWTQTQFLVGDRVRMTDEAVAFFNSDVSNFKGQYSADTAATVVDIFHADMGLKFWIHVDGEACPTSWSPYWWEKKRGTQLRLPAPVLQLPAPQPE